MSMVRRQSLVFILCIISITGFAQPCTGISIADADVSPQRILRVYYDNDLFAGTDRYYTQGFRIDLITPRFRDLWLSKRVLFRLGRRPRTFYGLSLQHASYTPDSISVPDIVRRDRPYARTTVFSHFLISNDLRNKIRLTTSLDIGFMGPMATLFLLQDSGLGSGTEGWENQIKTDLILGYRAKLEKGLLSTQGVDILAFGEASASTLQTYAGLGAKLRLGFLNPYFYDLHFSNRTIYGSRAINNVQVFLHGQASIRAFAYDATLQGGLLNRSSPYTLTGAEISRIRPLLSGGIQFIIKRLGLGYEHFFEGKAFKVGESHSWGQIKLYWLW